jgi:C4-dicarboxylate-specific signal transduction histidine kinase
MATVATYLHTARRMLLSDGDHQAAMDVLGKAELEAQRAREVLERVRDFVSGGALELDSVNLLDIALKLRDICKEGANARGVRVDVAGPRPPLLVRADRIAVEQLLSNLIANAVDAASERADARGIVAVRVKDCADHVVIEVEDNGPGVAPELAENLFDAYQTTKPRGMGLGLTLSRRIVLNHFGRLWWQPVASGGALFVVELPVHGPNFNAA